MKIFDIAPVKYLDGKMLILDQTKLPGEEIYIEMETKEDVWDAIYKLQVRGAPAIGVAAAYGLSCTYGTVAVDPSVFPLGSLLYIEGYGYAIANDVGTSIKGNVVDLYMERYDQCLMWGAHSVNVYLVAKP